MKVTKYTLLFISFLFPFSLLAQIPSKFKDNLKAYSTLALDVEAVKKEAKKASLLSDLSTNRNSPSVVSFRLPDGNTEQFQVLEAPVLSGTLSKKYPEIKSYAVQGIDDPTAYGRFNISTYGIYAYISVKGGMMILEPFESYSDTEDYISYYEHDILNVTGSCELANTTMPEEIEGQPFANSRDNSCFQNGANLRTFDLIVTCTGEFYTLNNGGGGDTDVIAAITNRVAAVNVVFGNDMAINLSVVETLLHTDAATDPFTNPTSTITSLSHAGQEIQDNSTVPYDLGHGFHEVTSGGWAGVAGLGVVCREDTGDGSTPVNGSSHAQKARGYTYQRNDLPTNNTVMIHEFGHMFGCNHANYGCSSEDACQRYEPGRGSTIMSTSANCTGDDFFANRSDYFGISSLQAMHDFINDNGVVFNSFSGPTCDPVGFSVGAGWGTCSVNTAITNNLPSSDANSEGIDGKTIPARTPFRLTGSASDADGTGSLTYIWEQYDTDYANSVLPDNAGTSTTAPLFRSFPPTATGNVRTLPQLSSILGGSTAGTGEVLPEVTRTMNWRLVVRDNNVGGGGIACDEITLNVEDTGNAFAVTSQSGATTWAGLDTETITWDVSDTDIAPISCSNVDILFSTDGGMTFPTTLLANTANTGSAIISVPNTPTTEGRIMVVCSDNVFFNLNTSNITITFTLPVDLISFTGRKVEDKVQLDWATASEENNSHFIIERSANGRDFDFLSQHRGVGTTSEANHYQAFDKKPLNGVNYYRLIQVDYDGTKKVEGKMVTLSFTNGHSISVVPNPVRSDIISISYQTELEGEIDLVIYDLNGRIINQITQNASKGNNQFDLTVPDLPNGIYLIRSSMINDVQTIRFVKAE